MKSSRTSLALWTVATALVFFTSGCGESTTPPPLPANLVAISSTTQAAVVATDVPSLPSVRVVDNAGNAVPNVPVTFEVTSGGGTITGETQNSDAQGLATVGSWTLGTQAGPNVLRATVANIPAREFTATGTPDAPFATR